MGVEVHYFDMAADLPVQGSEDAVLPFQEVRPGQVHSGDGMTREWVLKDNLTSAETVVRLMFEAMPQDLKEIFTGAGRLVSP